MARRWPRVSDNATPWPCPPYMQRARICSAAAHGMVSTRHKDHKWHSPGCRESHVHRVVVDFTHGSAGGALSAVRVRLLSLVRSSAAGLVLIDLQLQRILVLFGSGVNTWLQPVKPHNRHRSARRSSVVAPRLYSSRGLWTAQRRVFTAPTKPKAASHRCIRAEPMHEGEIQCRISRARTVCGNQRNLK